MRYKDICVSYLQLLILNSSKVLGQMESFLIPCDSVRSIVKPGYMCLIRAYSSTVLSVSLFVVGFLLLLGCLVKLEKPQESSRAVHVSPDVQEAVHSSLFSTPHFLIGGHIFSCISIVTSHLFLPQGV